MRFLLAAVFLALAGLALGLWREDAAARRDVETFIATWKLETRMPELVEDARNTPRWNDAYAAMADATLRDALGSTNVNTMTAAERREWIQLVARQDEQIADARALMRRTGEAWPHRAFHHGMLGQLAFAADARGTRTAVAEWMVPLSHAMRLAPANDAIATFTAGAILEGWPQLDEAQRAAASSLVSRAFHDAAFVARAWPLSEAIWGRDVLITMIPDQGTSIRAALAQLAEAEDIGRYARLVPRWESVERRDRSEDLAELERLRALDDVWRLRPGVRQWLASHRADDFEGAVTDTQIARVLALDPGGNPGTWRGDVRAHAIRHFLEGGRTRIDRVEAGAPLERAAASLSGIPETVLARILLHAGADYEAQRMHDRAPTRGSFSWLPYLVEAGHAALERGDAGRAQEAIAQLPVTAAGDCEAMLLRARARTGRAVQPGLPLEFADTAWSPTGTISLCLDETAEALTVSFTLDDEAVIDARWDRARLWTRHMPAGRHTLRIPTMHYHGRHTLTLDARIGPDPRNRRVHLTARP